jgi:hypothetical protein
MVMAKGTAPIEFTPNTRGPFSQCLPNPLHQLQIWLKERRRARPEQDQHLGVRRRLVQDARHYRAILFLAAEQRHQGRQAPGGDGHAGARGTQLPA